MFFRVLIRGAVVESACGYLEAQGVSVSAWQPADNLMFHGQEGVALGLGYRVHVLGSRADGDLWQRNCYTATHA